MGAAWERHAMCESAFSFPRRILLCGVTYAVHNPTLILDIYLSAYFKQIKNNTLRHVLDIYILSQIQIF